MYLKKTTIQKIENFWLRESKYLKWKSKNGKVLQFNKSKRQWRWFNNWKINIYENCITKNIKEGNGDKTCITYIGNENKIQNFSYSRVSEISDKYCEFFSTILKKNSKVMLHLSASIETSVMMLSLSRMGIHFSVIFEELEDQAIQSRVNIFKPNLLISSKYLCKPKFLNKNLLFLNIDKIKNLNESELTLKKKNSYFDSNKKFFTLFTSGSTGQPKAITHSYGGYTLYANFTCRKQFNINKNSKILTASDPGWINGHTYALFGPLSIGCTTIIIKKPYMILNLKILKLLNKINPSIIYLPVTLIRMLKSLYKKNIYKFSNLKTIGSMGEPLANSVGIWYSKFFKQKKKSIINTYFQTETGGIISSPNYKSKDISIEHGNVGKPCSKFTKLNKIHSKKMTELIITYPWPGCMIDIENKGGYWKKYFDKNLNFKLFDLATKINGKIYIHGRTDDVINLRGHRIGTAEIESKIQEISNVTENCAIFVDDDKHIMGGELYSFIACKKKISIEKIKKKLITNFGSFSIPKRIIFIYELPKTRSGKILRRLLKKMLIEKNNFTFKDKDYSTIINKKNINSILNAIINE